MENGFWICPNCGEELKESAHFCPNCGSDSETGWSDQCYLDGADWDIDEWEPEEEERSKAHIVVVAILVILIVVGLLSAL
jgi:uncharacterized membrane protein YvbJ